MSINTEGSEGQGLQSQLPSLTTAAAQSTQRAVWDPKDPGLLDSISDRLCEGGVVTLTSQRGKLKNRRMKLGALGRRSSKCGHYPGSRDSARELAGHANRWVPPGPTEPELSDGGPAVLFEQDLQAMLMPLVTQCEKHSPGK